MSKLMFLSCVTLRSMFFKTALCPSHSPFQSYDSAAVFSILIFMDFHVLLQSSLSSTPLLLKRL